jgi:transcriptional regulator with XRE-family HTH domain
MMNQEAIKLEFARRLQQQMILKGWNQSELSRRASEHLPRPPKGQKQGITGIGRDSFSHYLRGRSLPRPAYLEAMAKALGVRPEDLMPAAAPSMIEAPPFEVKGMPGGRMYLRINRTVTAKTATKIMELLSAEDALER